jgi:5-methylcytosine-specific restriction endonuclease McrA
MHKRQRSNREIKAELKEIEEDLHTQRKRRDYLRQILRVRAMREDLIREMGGACAVCGRTKSLEFDHYPERTTERFEKFNQGTRLRKYAAEWRRGNLRLLCCWCNGAAGGCVSRMSSIEKEEGTPVLSVARQ